MEVGDGDEGGAGGGAGEEEPQMSLADLMPKVDIRYVSSECVRLSLLTPPYTVHVRMYVRAYVRTCVCA